MQNVDFLMSRLIYVVDLIRIIEGSHYNPLAYVVDLIRITEGSHNNPLSNSNEYPQHKFLSRPRLNITIRRFIMCYRA